MHESQCVMTFKIAKTTKTRPLAAVLISGFVFACAGSADAALNSYLYLKGQKQGAIVGTSTQKNRLGWIVVFKASGPGFPLDMTNGNYSSSLVEAYKSNKTQQPFEIDIPKSDPSVSKIMTAMANKEPVVVNAQLWNDGDGSIAVIAGVSMPSVYGAEGLGLAYFPW